MKKIMFFVFVFVGFAYAQSPKMTVRDADSLQVKMSQMIVDVKIVGNIAYTTTEMHFTNKTSRQMEAELLFPLPEGVSVSRYAIDINGKMREAVPVDKNKGKQVFEAIENKRVDPGLLEKVDGNNFKTRIYPINPNGERIVIIGYQQELIGYNQSNLGYQMVSKFPYKLDKFLMTISVLNTEKPVIQNDKQAVEVQQWNQYYKTTIDKTNYKPAEKILVTIPIKPESTNIAMQKVNENYYFYANTLLESPKIAKPKIDDIGIIWDVSLSCKNRDLKKELDLLDQYFKHLQQTKITLYTIGYNFEKVAQFQINNGNWNELHTLLEKIKYDGGTRFSKINPNRHDEILFFSDGLSSLSKNEWQTKNNIVNTITSNVVADFSYLNYCAIQAGGSFVNLNDIDAKSGFELLTSKEMKFLGIKENNFIAEMFPIKNTKVGKNFSISGISLKAKTKITLLFGYDQNATIEREITLDADTQQTEVTLEKLWAQKKIANLEYRYEQNKEEIETLGKKYGIVTQNTSLIVLESLNDYLQYDIVPPAELREEFDRIKKQQTETRINQQKSSFERVAQSYNMLRNWWNNDTKYKAPEPVKPEPVKAEYEPSDNYGYIVGNTSRNRITGVVYLSNEPLPGANVLIRGTQKIVTTNRNGRFSINVRKGDIVVVSYLSRNYVFNATPGRDYSIDIDYITPTSADSNINTAISKPTDLRADIARERANAKYETLVTVQKKAIEGISGKVTKDIIPFVGATVLNKTTNQKTTTNKKGFFTLMANNNDRIQISNGKTQYNFKAKKGMHYNVDFMRVIEDIAPVDVQKVEKIVEHNSIQANEIAPAVNASPSPVKYNVLQEVIVNNPPRMVAKKSMSVAIASVSSAELVVRRNEDNIKELSNGINNSIEIYKDSRNRTKTTSWSPDRVYLKVLEQTPAEKQYAVYLELRDEQEENPSYYFDVANFFYNKGQLQKALLVLSNIADLGLENHQLYKSLTYTFRTWEAYQDALYTANQVVKWRPQEPQAHRDLALTLEDNQQYQEAFDTMVAGLNTKYYGEMSGQYDDVEDVILMDINRMVTEHKSIKIGDFDPKLLQPMPVDVRILLNWNQMNTDIDMHVIEPNGEECYYGHKTTLIGAHFGKDFTQGYGPEQYLLRNAIKGKFQIRTNFFGESTLTQNGPATVLVEIYTTKNGKTERKLNVVQLGKVKEKQNLAELIFE